MLNSGHVMVVIRAGADRLNLTMDARHLGMRRKRVQRSQFAHLKKASAADQLMVERRPDPCMSEFFPWARIPDASMKLLRDEHRPGKSAILVGSPPAGLRTFSDTRAARYA